MKPDSSENSLNGWTFEVLEDTTKPVGSVYSNIKNLDCYFAKEISVERIIVDVDGLDDPVSLKYADFEKVVPSEANRNLGYRPKTNSWEIDVANFSVYKGQGKPIVLKTRPLVLADPDGVDAPLFLVIAFLFGSYGHNPPHEFTGGLSAARFTPATRFETKNKRVKSVRVDYRYRFDVQSFLGTPLFPETKAQRQASKKQNYASIIRDGDHFPALIIATYQLLKEILFFDKSREGFASELKACNFAGKCEGVQETFGLGIVADWKERLDISFLDSRAAQVKDPKVALLNVKTYDPSITAVVDELTRLVVNGMALPFTTSPSLQSMRECMVNNIRYRLVQLAYDQYCVNKSSVFLGLIQTIAKESGPDLRAFLKEVHPLGITAGVLKKLWDLLPAGKTLSALGFAGVEKPVLFEVIGQFVDKGLVDETWDNLHWWGTQSIPSAPGAFFAIHSHYRWSQLNTYPSEIEAEFQQFLNLVIGTHTPLHLREDRLRSMVKTFAGQQLSGPLIDPKIPKQTVCFAIAEDGSTLDEELKTTTIPFEHLKGAKGIKLKEIAKVGTLTNEGANIVCWFSAKAERESGKAPTDAFRGTLFVNGFYFAHDKEKPFSLFNPARPANMFGQTEGIDIQKPERKTYQLFRGPFDK